MPLYEYLCQNCDGVFELLRPVREASLAQPCPVCDRDAERIMPTDFAAYVMRSGMPRKIPDQGLHWTLKGQSKEPYRGQKDMDSLLVRSGKPKRPRAGATSPLTPRLVKRRGDPLPADEDATA